MVKKNLKKSVVVNVTFQPLYEPTAILRVQFLLSDDVLWSIPHPMSHVLKTHRKGKRGKNHNNSPYGYSSEIDFYTPRTYISNARLEFSFRIHRQFFCLKTTDHIPVAFTEGLPS